MTNETGGTLRRRGAYLVIGIISLVISLPVLNHGFVNYDDYQLVVAPGREGRLAVTYANLTDNLLPDPESSYIPLRSLLFMLLYNLGGGSPWLFHLASLALYVLVSLLVYAVAHRLLAWDGHGALPPAGELSAGNFWPLFAAALFCTSPLNVESLAWVSAVKDLLLALFWLACLLNVMQAEQAGESKRKLGLALLFFVLALTAKPAAALLPAVVFSWYVLRPRAVEQAVSYRWVLTAALAVIAAYLFYLYPHLQRLEIYRHEGGPGSVAAGALSVFWTYLGNFLLPTGLSVRYLVKVPLNFFNPATLLYAAGLLAILAAVIVAWRRGRRLPAFAGAWAVLAFVPSSGVVPLEILRADRYTLTMLPAFAIAVAYLLRKLAGGAGASREKRLRLAVCALPLLFAVLFVSRLAVWRNSESLWTDVLDKRPDHYIALNGLAKVRLDQGDTTSAVAYFNRALEANPHSVLSLQSLGILYDRAGDHREAEDCLLKAVSEPADRAQSRTMLAEFYLRRARLTEARAALEKLVAEDPDDTHLNYLLSTCYQRLGLLDLAETCLRRARAYDPGNPVYLTGLGRLQVQKGDLEYAVDLLGLSLAADQDYAPTYVGLGEMFLAAGKLADSRNSFTAALTREPGNVEALSGMAGVYGRAGRLDSAAVLLDRLLALDPRDCRAQVNLVALRMAGGETAAAAGLLDQAIGCDSTVIENYLNGCRIYLALDSLARAEQMVRTAYRLAPSNPAVQAAVSDFRRRTGR